MESPLVIYATDSHFLRRITNSVNYAKVYVAIFGINKVGNHVTMKQISQLANIPIPTVEYSVESMRQSGILSRGDKLGKSRYFLVSQDYMKDNYLRIAKQTAGLQG